ncbi:hypothetical protein [Nonomuraea sp. NPDC046570]|uniref:hypothetical protein n=1 Tax=Nonomuraea sp. NPDC046570 TaxID=3155255 RepID=UPI0034032374
MGALCALAESADRQGDQASASAVFNQAALLVSDVGLPDLARQICRRHATTYLRAHPLGAQVARLGLEPLVNLARLQIRNNEGDTAFQLLDRFYEAITAQMDTVIDGVPVPGATLTTTTEDHRELCQWLWTVVLADGARALISSGRWQDAQGHLRRHNGIGQRLLDGRQVAVLAHCIGGETTSALALLEESTLSEPWEQAVAACLTVLCLRSGGRPADTAAATMCERYQALAPSPGLPVFRARLGLTVIDLASSIGQIDTRAATHLVHEAIENADGYVARDILAHNGCRAALTDEEERALTLAVQSAGLGLGSLPAHLMADLFRAVKTSERAIERSL